MVPASATPQDLQQIMEREQLRGLRTALVGGGVSVPELPEAPDLTDQNVRTDFEVRLRQAGLRLVPTINEAEATVDVLANALPINDRSGRVIYTVRIQVTERALLKCDPSRIVSADVWSRFKFGVIAPTGLRPLLRDFADRLANDYLAANPK